MGTRSARWASGAAVAVLGLASASCGALHHEYMFTPRPDVKAAPGHNLEGKKVHMDLSGTPDSFRQSANGHSFHVFGIREHVKNCLTGVLVGAEWVADAAGAERVLAVTVEIRLSGAFAGTEADATVTCRIRDAGGKDLSEGTGKGNSSFPVMSNGGRNCEIACLLALGDALGAAASKP